jgi:hypothetical protein
MEFDRDVAFTPGRQTQGRVGGREVHDGHASEDARCAGRSEVLGEAPAAWRRPARDIKREITTSPPLPSALKHLNPGEVPVLLRPILKGQRHIQP